MSTVVQVKAPPLMARFRPQALIDDYFVEVDGQVDFDATEAILSLSVNDVRRFRENDYSSDALAEDLPARQEHGGPFEVDVDLNGWLEFHGVDDRYNLSGSRWDAIRAKYRSRPQYAFPMNLGSP